MRRWLDRLAKHIAGMVFDNLGLPPDAALGVKRPATYLARDHTSTSGPDRRFCSIHTWHDASSNSGLRTTTNTWIDAWSFRAANTGVDRRSSLAAGARARRARGIARRTAGGCDAGATGRQKKACALSRPQARAVALRKTRAHPRTRRVQARLHRGNKTLANRGKRTRRRKRDDPKILERQREVAHQTITNPDAADLMDRIITELTLSYPEGRFALQELMALFSQAEPGALSQPFVPPAPEGAPGTAPAEPPTGGTPIHAGADIGSFAAAAATGTDVRWLRATYTGQRCTATRTGTGVSWTHAKRTDSRSGTPSNSASCCAPCRSHETVHRNCWVVALLHSIQSFPGRVCKSAQAVDLQTRA